MIGGFIQMVRDVLFTDPIRQMYLKGPPPLFWGGHSRSTICSKLTNTEQTFWVQPHSVPECDSLVERHFESFRTSVSIAMYAVVCFKIYTALWWRYMYAYPLLREFHRTIRDVSTIGAGVARPCETRTT